jgi:carboxymethylenebutenolidase
MCFPVDAQPPILAIAGAAIDSQDLTLKAADGTEFAAFAARAEKPNGAGMVVLPDVRGLFHFYEELALRFAEQGINAVAIDYFGRTAGVSKRNDPEFKFMEHVAQTQTDTIAADTAAAIAYLRSPEGGSCTSIFTVGFCFGGSNSWNQAALQPDLSGAIGFYGHSGRKDAAGKSVIDRVPEMNCPILGLQAGADQMITADINAEFEKALTDAGVEHEIITYPDTPHSFFDRSYEQHAEASKDAWQRILAFVEKNKK